jgi:hypothetical protein
MKICPQCNQVFDDSQTFCLHDGSPLQLQSDNTKERKKSKLPLIFIGLLSLLGVSVIAWFLFASREQNNGQSNKQVVVTSTQTPVSAPSVMQTETPTPVPSPTPTPTAATEINSNTAGNANSDSNPTEAGDVTKSTTPALKIEDHSVVFDLRQCRKSGTSITCDFSLTNKGQDRRFGWIAGRSNLYDELGNGYNGRTGQLAKENGYEPRINFISGVTTKAQVTFEKIEPSAAKITLLRIQFDVGDDYGLEVKFRNVPLSVSK